MRHSVNFSIQRQAQDNWCWAAVSSSVDFFFTKQPNWPQCAIVNAHLGQLTCCVDGSTAACDQPSSLSAALTLVGHLREFLERPLNFSECLAEIKDRKNPICVRIAWDEENGHFVAIGGCDDSAEELVTVYDPWYGSSDIPYSKLLTSYRDAGTWSHSYYLS